MRGIKFKQLDSAKSECPAFGQFLIDAAGEMRLGEHLAEAIVSSMAAIFIGGNGTANQPGHDARTFSS